MTMIVQAELHYRVVYLLHAHYMVIFYFSLQVNRMIWAGTKEGILSFGLGLPYRILKTEILRDTTGILRFP